MTPHELETHSKNHIRECMEFYREHAPLHPGELVKVNDECGKLYAIGRCAAVYWNQKIFDWIVCVEIMEEFGLCIGEFNASQCQKYVGFRPEVKDD